MRGRGFPSPGGDLSGGGDDDGFRFGTLTVESHPFWGLRPSRATSGDDSERENAPCARSAASSRARFCLAKKRSTPRVDGVLRPVSIGAGFSMRPRDAFLHGAQACKRQSQRACSCPAMIMTMQHVLG